MFNSRDHTTTTPTRTRHIARLLRAAGIVTVMAAVLAIGGLRAERADAAGMRIYDVQVIAGNSSSISCPSGYSKNGQDLNAGAGGKYIYLCIKSGNSISLHGYVDEIEAVSGSSSVSCSSGYTRIGQDLNAGAGGKYVYFCVKYTTNYLNALAGIEFFSFAGSTPRWIAEASAKTGCTGSTGNLDLTDLNDGAGGKYIYTCSWG